MLPSVTARSVGALRVAEDGPIHTLVRRRQLLQPRRAMI